MIRQLLQKQGGSQLKQRVFCAGWSRLQFSSKVCENTFVQQDLTRN